MLQNTLIKNLTVAQLQKILGGIAGGPRMEHSPAEEKLYTSAEIRKVFKPVISHVTLLRWQKKGYIKPIMIGTKGYFRYSDIVMASEKSKRVKSQIQSV